MEELYNLLLKIIANSPNGHQLPTLETLEPDQSILVFKPGENKPYLIRKDKIVFVGEPITTLKGLSDTPDSYAGQKGKILVVKQDETGFEYKVLAEVTGVTEQQLNDAVEALEAQIAALESSSGTPTTKIISFSPNWQGGLTFNPNGSWFENGVSDLDSRQLIADAADPDNGRFDKFIIDLTLGQIQFLKGTASANPVVPEITDPLTQLDTGIFIFIPAGATEPDGALSDLVYDGDAVGWTAGTSVNWNLQSINGNPFGTYCLEITGELLKSAVVPFTPPAPVAIGGTPETTFKIKNKTTGNDPYWIFTGLDKNGKPVREDVRPIGYDTNSLEWQILSVPIPTSRLITLEKSFLGMNTAGAKYYLDDVKLVTGIGSVTADYATKEELAALEDRVAALEGGGAGLDVRMSNLVADLSTAEKDAIKAKLGIASGLTQEDIDEPIVVDTPRAFAATDIGKVLFVTAGVTLTYPAGGIPKFKCNIMCSETGLGTLAGQAAELDFPDGQIIDARKAVTLFLRPDDSRLTGYGEFTA